MNIELTEMELNIINEIEININRGLNSFKIFEDEVWQIDSFRIQTYLRETKYPEIIVSIIYEFNNNSYYLKLKL